MRRILFFLLCAAIVAGAGFLYYLFRPPAVLPQPASGRCLPIGEEDGDLVPLNLAPAHIYGMGLTYSGHIAETASSFNPIESPPIFPIDTASLNHHNVNVPIPTRQAWLDAAERLEPGLGKQVGAEFSDIPILLDYEVELAFILQEDIEPAQLNEPSYAPKLGYFIANDLTSRSFQVLSWNQPNPEIYWGVSKSFPGFKPVGSLQWVPKSQQPDSMLCTTLSTRINGEVRQHQSTIYLTLTPKQMLRFIAEKYPEQPLRRGDVVLTGTPSGIALAIPRWRKRFASFLGLSRIASLSISILTYRDDPNFLKPGDRVTVTSPLLGESSVLITKQ